MSATTNKKWNKFDTAWVLNLFGTAVGAGVLFLPINAGMGGLLAIGGNGYLSRTNDILCSSWFGLFRFIFI